MKISLATLGLLFCPALTLFAQKMSPEAMANIHTLLDNHGSITRTVELTKDGYTATTESTDTTIARVLREHVAQMGERLESGLMVRRWDPAFVEYVAHWSEMTHTIVPTRAGFSITVHAMTPEAVSVAQNHAQIVSDFAAEGWEAHNRTHTTVAEPQHTGEAQSCCGSGSCGMGQKHMRMGRGSHSPTKAD